MADEDVGRLLRSVVGSTRFSAAAFDVLFALLAERDRRGETLDREQVRSGLSQLIDQAGWRDRPQVNAFEVVKHIGSNWCGFPPFCDRVP